MLGIGLGMAEVAARGRRDTPPDWPEGAAALWLILGQSNAEGYAPWRQDPARANPAAAVPALTEAERQFHPWLRLSSRGALADTGRFAASGQGVATDAFPRTSDKVWNNGDATALGIPTPTQAFGPEIGLVRHVLSGAAPATWRDDAGPRLYIFKQVEGGRSVDHFRWGGAGQHLILGALRQSGGTNLTSLAANRPVLVQGIIFVIGEHDAENFRPDTGGSMAETMAPRFADWVRQLRGALGVQAPVAFVEVAERGFQKKIAANAALAALAAAIPDAVVVEAEADWTDVGDNVHYDAQGQDRLGAAAFARLREGWGRPGDGLVTAFPFTGLKPWFHLPPVFIRDNGWQMRLAACAAMDGVLHARVTAPDEPAPSAEAIRDASLSAGGFRRSLTADVEEVWYSGGGFTADVTQDCHIVLEGPGGVLGERVTLRRGGNVKFSADLAATSVGATTATLSASPGFGGTLRWALHVGDRAHIRAEDVEAMAFGPIMAGEAAAAWQPVTVSLTGLAPGTPHTVFITGRRSSDGLRAPVDRVVFTTL